MVEFNCDNVARIARRAARDSSRAVTVAGVMRGAGGTDYVEVLFNIAGSSQQVGRVSLGVFRNESEDVLREHVSSKLTQELPT